VIAMSATATDMLIRANDCPRIKEPDPLLERLREVHGPNGRADISPATVSRAWKRDRDPRAPHAR
jgi:hypothetical protein